MKQCLTCGHLSEVDAPHCIHCGEASWSEPEIDSDPVEGDTEPSTPKAKARGRK